MCNMFSNVDLYIRVLAKKRGQGTSAHVHCYTGSVEKVCWLSMIPGWNQAKYTVISEACCDMEVVNYNTCLYH